ncbi:MAG TPA: hypothetical protein VK870_13445 [Ignavibacteriaceae bacterium]|nr:hypothetical protein [Ignavibacteriaceae bacterium]
MKNIKQIKLLVLLIALASIIAASYGILSKEGAGNYEIESVRGEQITIYGKGLYQHMSSDVAIQGIAQDYVTLFIGVPLLLISLSLSRKNSLRGLFLLAGTLGYFLVTYLFYLTMGMYNQMFLVYAFLLGTTFFAFILAILEFDLNEIKSKFTSEKLARNAGTFLIINASLVGLLWLGVVLPPIFEGTLYPKELQHYTTLIVQGFDLGLLLPMAFVVGILAIKKNRFGFLFTPIYMIFLSLLMTALVSKILFMAGAGQNVIPVIFIMPTIVLISISFSILLLKNIKKS